MFPCVSGPPLSCVEPATLRDFLILVERLQPRSVVQVPCYSCFNGLFEGADGRTNSPPINPASPVTNTVFIFLSLRAIPFTMDGLGDLDR
jgi:hypothetical protein